MRNILLSCGVMKHTARRLPGARYFAFEDDGGESRRYSILYCKRQNKSFIGKIYSFHHLDVLHGLSVVYSLIIIIRAQNGRELLITPNKLVENGVNYEYLIENYTALLLLLLSSHSFWTSSSLDVPAGVTQEEGHTGFLIHLLSAVRALIFLARRIQSFLSLVGREVEFY